MARTEQRWGRDPGRWCQRLGGGDAFPPPCDCALVCAVISENWLLGVNRVLIPGVRSSPPQGHLPFCSFRVYSDSSQLFLPSLHSLLCDVTGVPVPLSLRSVCDLAETSLPVEVQRHPAVEDPLPRWLCLLSFQSPKSVGSDPLYPAERLFPWRG